MGLSARKRLGANLSFAKQFVSEQILRQLLSYIGRNPENNLPRLFDLVERFAPLEAHKRQVREARERVLGNPAMKTLAFRLLKETDPHVQRKLGYNWFANSALFGIPKQRRLSEELGFNVPHFILIDPTSACNLKCVGCWAGEYPKHDTLPPELVDRIITEAKELGIYWIVMSGGEPMIYPHLFEIASKHDDVAFMLFTNGTLIDDKRADKMLEVGNISPAISLEGWKEDTDSRRGEGVFDELMRVMDRLRERGIPFGFSLTLTRNNVERAMSDEFIDFLVDKGCTYGWLFHYIPIGRDINPDMLITSQQRAYLAERVPYLRSTKPILFADFWNDGQLTLGCIAGGRRYFHITAKGDVEPCAFVHFAVDNIRDKSLREILASPFFRVYQKGQPFSENLLRPCPIIDVPWALREIIRETGAHPTHPGADSVLEPELAELLDRRAEEWKRVSDPIWAARVAEAKRAEKTKLSAS